MHFYSHTATVIALFGMKFQGKRNERRNEVMPYDCIAIHVSREFLENMIERNMS